MPRSPQGVALTDAYRTRLLAQREATSRLLVEAWASVELADLDTSFARWLRQAAALVEAGKRASVAVTDGYLAAFIAAEALTETSPRGLDPAPYLDTSDGRPLTQALGTPLLTVKAALTAGAGVRALRLGLGRATRIAAVESLDAPRRALGDLMREESRVTGQTRVVSATACGACLALASGVEAKAAAHRTHSCCRCVWEPSLRGVPDRLRRPTGREVFDRLAPDEQARLFHGRGGAEKADLVRTGAVPFASLAKREPMARTPDQFTEPSLEELRNSARPEGAGHPLSEESR